MWAVLILDEAKTAVEAAKKELAYHQSKLQVAQLQQDLNDARNEALTKLGEAAAAEASTMKEDRRKEEEATIFTPRNEEEIANRQQTPKNDESATTKIRFTSKRKKKNLKPKKTMTFKTTSAARPLS